MFWGTSLWEELLEGLEVVLVCLHEFSPSCLVVLVSAGFQFLHLKHILEKRNIKFEYLFLDLLWGDVDDRPIFERADEFLELLCTIQSGLVGDGSLSELLHAVNQSLPVVANCSLESIIGSLLLICGSAWIVERLGHLKAESLCVSIKKEGLTAAQAGFEGNCI